MANLLAKYFIGILTTMAILKLTYDCLFFWIDFGKSHVVVIFDISTHYTMKKIIYSRNNKFCIDIPEGKMINGQHLQIWGKHRGENQKWSIKRDS